MTNLATCFAPSPQMALFRKLRQRQSFWKRTFFHLNGIEIPFLYTADGVLTYPRLWVSTTAPRRRERSTTGSGGCSALTALALPGLQAGGPRPPPTATSRPQRRADTIDASAREGRRRPERRAHRGVRRGARSRRIHAGGGGALEGSGAGASFGRRPGGGRAVAGLCDGG